MHGAVKRGKTQTSSGSVGAGGARAASGAFLGPGPPNRDHGGEELTKDALKDTTVPADQSPPSAGEGHRSLRADVCWNGR